MLKNRSLSSMLRVVGWPLVFEVLDGMFFISGVVVNGWLLGS